MMLSLLMLSSGLACFSMLFLAPGFSRGGWCSLHLLQRASARLLDPGLRKQLCLGLCLALLAPSFALASASPPAAPPSRELRILCSFFPVYQLTRNVVAGRPGVQVELMLPPTLGCPHDYLLTPQDMARIARADVFVANGLGLEEFLGAPLRRANPQLAVIDASAGATDPIAGSAEHAHGHDHPASDASRQGGLNPHLFASPAVAARMVTRIAEGLAKLDPDGAELYKKNAAAYAARLRALADEFSATVKSLPSRRIVTTHDVFAYLARDTGLQVVAVIEPAPGQEPSAAQMLDLVKKIKTSGAAAVFTEPQYPAAVGRTIAREAGIPVAMLDPVASGPPDAPLDYYEKTMRQNLLTLKRTLARNQK